MPSELRRLFVPFGEMRPDAKQFNNQGLQLALNVVPIHGNYVAAQMWSQDGDEPADEPYGLHSHFAGGTTWYAYVGSITALYQYETATFTATNKTRAAGGAYATSSAGGEAGWQFSSFGSAIIGTQYVDDPQLLTSPAAANFVKLAQSGGGNPGMDPKAKFVYALRGNLHLANLNLAAGFDTLPSGANPTVVCWSQTENVRQYGSFSVTPQLTGTGYQPLNYDFGHIAGAIGGDFGIIFLQGGIVREDGPPYVFRPIVVGPSCRFPNSIVRLDQDIYFWGPSGPAVLRGGEGPVLNLGDGRVARTLIDNATGFSPTYSIYSGVPIRHVGGAVDPVNGVVAWTITSTEGDSFDRVGDLTIYYNTRDDRFSFASNTPVSDTATGDIWFVEGAPDIGGAWGPARDLVAITSYIDGVTTHWQVARPYYGSVRSAPAITMTQAYQQLDKDFATRVQRVRPIFSRAGSTTAATVTVTLSSKNKPYDAAVTTSSTTADGHGWVTLPNSKMADFHLVSIELAGDLLQNVAEFEGYEIEFLTGPRYSA